jgi:Rps23 Pro-64 3,4-dihydroxylase Tpa1-like proline 4-hydroxylase
MKPKQIFDEMKKEMQDIKSRYGNDLEVLSHNQKLREFQDKLLELKSKISASKQRWKEELEFLEKIFMITRDEELIGDLLHNRIAELKEVIA